MGCGSSKEYTFRREPPPYSSLQHDLSEFSKDLCNHDVEVVIFILNEDPVELRQIAITPGMDDQSFFDEVRRLDFEWTKKQDLRVLQKRRSREHWRFASFDRISAYRYVHIKDGGPVEGDPGAEMYTYTVPPEDHHQPIPKGELKYHFNYCFRGGQEHQHKNWLFWTNPVLKCSLPPNPRYGMLDRLPKRQGFLQEGADSRERFYGLIIGPRDF